METISGYLADRFRTHTSLSNGYRATFDSALLTYLYEDLNQQQRIELPLVSIRSSIIDADPLLMAFASDDELYVQETVSRYVHDAFSSHRYKSFGGLIDERIADFGSRHARLIQRLNERLEREGPLSGARFYLEAFEGGYRMQFEIENQRDDLRSLERMASRISGPKAPIDTLSSAFKRADPFLNWVHDALVDYHDFRFVSEALEQRGYEHLSANSHAHLTDHFARRTIQGLLGIVADRVARPLEREIFPGDEVEPLTH